MCTMPVPSSVLTKSAASTWNELGASMKYGNGGR